MSKTITTQVLFLIKISRKNQKLQIIANSSECWKVFCIQYFSRQCWLVYSTHSLTVLNSHWEFNILLICEFSWKMSEKWHYFRHIFFDFSTSASIIYLCEIVPWCVLCAVSKPMEYKILMFEPFSKVLKQNQNILYDGILTVVA